MKNNVLYASSVLPGIEALSCSSHFSFGSHIHNGHVLWLNSEGGEYFTLKGSTEMLQPGSISVIEPGIVHSNRPCEKGGRHLRSLYLDREFFLYVEKMETGSATGKICLPTARFQNIRQWKQAVLLHEAIITGEEQIVLEHLVLLLFSHLRESLPRWKQEANIRSCTDYRLPQIIDYMRAHLGEKISLNELAQIARCTSFHIIRIFKTGMGMSPHAYLVQLRLEQARQYMDKGYTIADAALLSGFSDQSHLNRVFSKRYGLTPGSYIAQKLS